jgi:hypothetical protein
MRPGAQTSRELGPTAERQARGAVGHSVAAARRHPDNTPQPTTRDSKMVCLHTEPQVDFKANMCILVCPELGWNSNAPRRKVHSPPICVCSSPRLQAEREAQKIVQKGIKELYSLA